MDKCLKLKYKWNDCSNLIMMKYLHNSDDKGYYNEMSPCFENYKKYVECMIKFKNN